MTHLKLVYSKDESLPEVGSLWVKKGIIFKVKETVSQPEKIVVLTLNAKTLFKGYEQDLLLEDFQRDYVPFEGRKE